ncbi:MAG TPA: hypothetical protein VEX68_20710 [Bryobacteraceae bacterium]|nr:hypothetical protein [Bryobacteraceae bacterium]
MRLWAIVALTASALGGQRLSDLSTIPIPMRRGDALILGFLGAWERWDDENRSVRKLALKLRSQGLHAETLSNHKRGVSLELIRKVLDANRNGRLSDKERSSVHIVLYGQSLGGLAVVKLARELEAMNVPVLLTVQIDSIGLTDVTIPKNVVQAANLHQQSRFSLRGQDVIRAADPNRTRIIETKQFEYSVLDPSDRPETWARRRLGGGHAQMEADPAVWEHVEDLILNALKGLQ